MLSVGTRDTKYGLNIVVLTAPEQRERCLIVESAVRSQHERHQRPDVAIAGIEHLSELTQATLWTGGSELPGWVGVTSGAQRERDKATVDARFRDRLPRHARELGDFSRAQRLPFRVQEMLTVAHPPKPRVGQRICLGYSANAGGRSQHGDEGVNICRRIGGGVKRLAVHPRGEIDQRIEGSSECAR
jgi:hypothetical protein